MIPMERYIPYFHQNLKIEPKSYIYALQWRKSLVIFMPRLLRCLYINVLDCPFQGVRTHAVNFQLVGACWCVLVCAGVCWCVLACAGVCWRVLVCAGVCWCVLVCAGVCEPVLKMQSSGWPSLRRSRPARAISLITSSDLQIFRSSDFWGGCWQRRSYLICEDRTQTSCCLYWQNAMVQLHAMRLT